MDEQAQGPMWGWGPPESLPAGSGCRRGLRASSVSTLLGGCECRNLAPGKNFKLFFCCPLVLVVEVTVNRQT